jgi:DNA transformation protein
MANSPSFVEHALDLLGSVGAVQARSMFGGHGVYARGVMFGLLDDDELFLKTDGETRPRFLAEGCRMWVYPAMDETSWYRPPDEAHEDAEAMAPWARLGLEAALRIRAVKDAAARAKAERRAAREAAAATKAKAAARPARKAPARKPAAKGKKAPSRKQPAPRRPAGRRSSR